MTNAVLDTISVSPGRKLRVIDCKADAPDPAQLNLWGKRTAGPEEKDKWMRDTLEILNTRRFCWPSDLYAILAVKPFHKNWIGAMWKMAEAHGWKKDWSTHRASKTPEAHYRTEFLRVKA